MRAFRLSLILIAALCAAPVAVAQEAKSFDAAAVLVQQRQIRSDIDAGSGAYGRLPADLRREVVKRQDALFQLLEGRSYEQLDESQRAQVSDDLAWIEAAPKQSAEERVVCERVKSMGSNRVERVCRTVAQRRADRDRADKRSIDRALEQRNVCANATCGGAP